MVAIAQLVERKANEMVCRAGDDGDIMFVLLRGEVGIVVPPAPATGEADFDGLVPIVTLGAGDTVGELAFALERPRTASVVAKTEVALLGFRYADVESRLRSAPFAGEALRRVDRFMRERVLAHLYEQAPGLVPAEREDTGGEHTSLAYLEDTLACTTVTKLEARAVVSREALAVVDEVEPGGVYVLVSGSLRSASVEEKRVQAARYRLLYVDLPGLVITPDHAYVVERRAVIVQPSHP